MNQKIAAYGSWQSPITATLLAEAGLRFLSLECSGEAVYWVELRPLEGGRYVIVRRTADGTTTDITPDGSNARTLVHEYGGGAAVFDGQTVYFSNFSDQALYRQDNGGAPTRITPAPLTPLSQRYADGRLTPDGKILICIRERHLDDGAVVNEIVSLPTAGSDTPAVIATGYDFYSNPRISPDGKQLAWLCWNHPLMPWDGTELWVAPLETDASLGPARQVAGGPHESIFQPEWSPQGILHFVSDCSNWWNLYRELDGQIEALAPMAAEFGRPQWVFGISCYTFLRNGHIACIYEQGGFDHLGIIEPTKASVTPIPCAFTSLSSLRTDGAALWLIGASPTQGPTVLRINPEDGHVEEIQRATEINTDPAYIATPEAIEFPTENDKTAHAFYYAPTNPDYTAPEGELPPLLVITHGGPTGATEAQLSLTIQYWTSRGFGIVDVDYGGSTGYGREYRERLRGAWGIVDVEDCINAAQFLVSQGRADPKRIGIRGGSAGGYTTLRALTWKQFFAVGASYFGLAELETFVYDTHKFESRYLDGLIGPYPECKSRYFDRSPVNFTDRLNCPLILFQGLEDKIVPPSQAEIMAEALKTKGMPYAYIAYEGEQHGFRKAENIIRSAEAELYFYSKIFGFELAEDIRPVKISYPGDKTRPQQVGDRNMTEKTIIIVSGLPRSGTSMMMKMLEAGGLPALTDNIRTADADNPKGYYEFERVKQIENDKEWLPQASGKVVKMISALLKHLPEDYNYKVIFMRRNIAEILASQERMLVRRGEPTDKVDDDTMRRLFEKHLQKVENWLTKQPDFDVLYVSYNAILEDPEKHAAKINQFLDNTLDEQAMLGVVDPALYRQRR